jgi:hypothetical protein
MPILPIAAVGSGRRVTSFDDQLIGEEFESNHLGEERRTARLFAFCSMIPKYPPLQAGAMSDFIKNTGLRPFS